MLPIPTFSFHELPAQLSFGSKRKLQSKLPHRLALAEFLRLFAKIYTLAASYDKFFNAHNLKLQKRASQCADVFYLNNIQPTKFSQNSSERALKKFIDSAAEAALNF